MPTKRAARRRPGLAALLTLGVVVSMALALVFINRGAVLAGYRGDNAAWVVVVATLAADAMLIGIIYRLILEALIAVAERDRDNIPVPALLSGLLIMYTLVLWTILAPTLNRIGIAADFGLFSDGWNEPESQLVRTAIIFAFVTLSYYWIVWRYQRGGLIDALRRSLADWRARRARAQDRDDRDRQGDS